jgi:hypothetical protein
MYVEDNTSKEKVLREIILWASEVKQKSIDLQTKYVLEFSEEIDKDIPCTCNEIAYSIHHISCAASELIEECKDAGIYMKDEHRIIIGSL